MTDDGFSSPQTNETSEEADQHRPFVINQLRAGAEPTAVVETLIGQGVSRSQASYLVESSQAAIMDIATAEQVDGRAIALGTVGGVLGASLGGAIWAMITVGTDSEFGLIAWGIGGLCGFAVALFARPKRGTPLQVVAVITSVLGIAIGKYGTFYLMARNYLEEHGGDPADISAFSPDFIGAFFGTLPEMLSGFDLIFVGLAVVTAWGIPKAGGLASLVKK